MIKKLFWLTLLLSIGSLSATFAQSASCGDSYLSPFCDGIAQYPANFDSSGASGGPQAPVGPNYDCLASQGNPSYFSLTIDRSGSIDFTLDNTANVDIDFILWGPFNGTSAAQQACDSMGNGGVWGDVADCSYSAISAEQVSIANAQAGEVYILMVTNFANVPTNIFSTSNSGTGNVACACAIDYTMDTLPSAAGNQGFLVDTSNNINRYVVCPNTSLGFALGSRAPNPRDTLGIYAPFTTIGNAFSNFNIASISPGAPTNFDSLLILGLLTPSNADIGVKNFTIGLRNDIFTGGFSDSTCFDFANVEVIVPGVQLQDRNVCPGEQFQIVVDSIPATSLGGSAYSWRQLSGMPITFSNTTNRSPTVTIPPTSSSSTNDSIVLVVDYNYGGLCPMSDTMVLRFSNLSLSLTATPDTMCASDSSQLDAVFSGILTQPICDDYQVTSIPFAPLSGTGTQVTNFTLTTDDGTSAALPIGFPFEFFCNTYTQFVMSTNGFISFDLNAGSGCCSGGTLPSTSDPNNLIALAWSDLNVTGSALEYFTVGTAPNRILVVNYNNINHFNGNNPVTAQLLLYETTNVIEIHTTSQPAASGIHTQGIENATGTIGFASPGRNAQQWTATNDAYRFSPRNNGPFFTWTPATHLSDATLQNPIATPDTTTTYTVVATDNRCTYVDTATLIVIRTYPAPTLICGSATDSTLAVSWNSIGLPGTGFYEYSIDGGATWVNVGTNLSTTIPNLLSGTSYTILVRGDDGTGGVCTLSRLGSIICTTNQRSCSGFPPLNITLNATTILCHGDSTACITGTVTGGTGNPIHYFWSTGQVDTNQICNLPADNYSLIVTDTIQTGGTFIVCRDTQAITIVQPAPLIIQVDTSINNTCSGIADGLVAVSTTGGTPAYTYLWNTGPGTDTLTNLANGVYTVTVTDNNGCTDTAQAIVNPTSPIVVTISNVVNNGCPGQTNGSININVIGGTLPLSYLWSNSDTNQTLLNVAEGTYTVTVTDNNGCFSTAQATITPTLALNLTQNITGPNCVGDSALVSIQATGGSGNYSYDWGSASNSTTNAATLDAGNYVVTISDINNGCVQTDTVTITAPDSLLISLVNLVNIPCGSTLNTGSIDITVTGGTTAYSYNWNTNATTEDLVGLSPGNYSLTVTDTNGCIAVGGPYTINTGAAITVTINNTVPTLACDQAPTGVLIAQATGGTNITYRWNNGDTNSTQSGLGAGLYTVIATNIDGCSDTATATIVAPIVPTLAAYVQTPGTRQTTVTMNTVVPIGAGSTGFTYRWTATADPNTGNPTIANPNAGITTATPDPSGLYTYTVTASATTNDTICTAMDTVSITVEPPFLGIPDAFTPNEDGTNDLFRPIYLSDGDVLDFRIFNRWGQEVYNGTQNNFAGWDGTYQGIPQPAEVYIYFISYQRASEPKGRTLKGEMTLIR